MDTLPLETLMPAFNLSVSLKVIGRCPDVIHPADSYEFLEVPGNKLGTVIRDSEMTLIFDLLRTSTNIGSPGSLFRGLGEAIKTVLIKQIRET